MGAPQRCVISGELTEEHTQTLGCGSGLLRFLNAEVHRAQAGAHEVGRGGHQLGESGKNGGIHRLGSMATCSDTYRSVCMATALSYKAAMLQAQTTRQGL
jgi:hydroxylamine reductase (hybrid-cluster protein)